MIIKYCPLAISDFNLYSMHSLYSLHQASQRVKSSVLYTEKSGSTTRKGVPELRGPAFVCLSNLDKKLA